MVKTVDQVLTNCREEWSNKKHNPRVVERTGYVPIKNRVEAILQAGATLQALRDEAYQYKEDEEPEDFDANYTQFDLSDPLERALEAENIISRVKVQKVKKSRSKRSSEPTTEHSEVESEGASLNDATEHSEVEAN